MSTQDFSEVSEPSLECVANGNGIKTPQRMKAGQSGSRLYCATLRQIDCYVKSLHFREMFLGSHTEVGARLRTLR